MEMSKAVLEMEEMPTNCKDCTLCIASQDKHSGQACWRCVENPTIMIPKSGDKPDWCPLKEITEDIEELRKILKEYKDLGTIEELKNLKEIHNRSLVERYEQYKVSKSRRKLNHR